MRLRLIGGHVRSKQLRSLSAAAQRFGDGAIHVTSRANLQVRAFPSADGQLDPDALDAIERTGLLPTRTHELVRNIMISPQTGLVGGRADLRAVGQDLDRLLCSNARLADLPGRFLFVLDDGRGDLRNRTCDLGLVMLDATTAQLRVGSHWGPLVRLTDAAATLAALADRFMGVRGEGVCAPWHVDELTSDLRAPQSPDPRLPAPSGPLPYGDVPGGRHVEVPPTGLDAGAVASLTAGHDDLIVTPWRGVLIPQETP